VWFPQVYSSLLWLILIKIREGRIAVTSLAFCWPWWELIGYSGGISKGAHTHTHTQRERPSNIFPPCLHVNVRLHEIASKPLDPCVWAPVSLWLNAVLLMWLLDLCIMASRRRAAVTRWSSPIRGHGSTGWMAWQELLMLFSHMFYAPEHAH